jgi:uncharacterized membrane protein YcjF (UPF0283 family)
VLWIVWVALVVLALVVLAVLAFQVLGAFTRLTREVGGLQRDLQPVLADVQATLARVAEQQSASAGEPSRPPVLQVPQQLTGR